MSATSNMKTPESEVVHELVERIGQRIADLTRQMGVDLSRARAAMTEVFLDEAKVDPGFQKMSRVGVPQRMHVRWFGKARQFQCMFECGLQSGDGDGAVAGNRDPAVIEWSRKQPGRRSMRLPEVAKQSQRPLRQRHIPVLTAFAMNADKHASPIDIFHPKLGAFGYPQSAAVDRRQASAIDGNSNLAENPAYFFTAKHNGQLLFVPRPNQLQRRPIAMQSVLEEKLNAAHRNRAGRPRHLFLVRQIQKILTQLFLRQLRRIALEMSKHLTDRSDVDTRVRDKTVEVEGKR